MFILFGILQQVLALLLAILNIFSFNFRTVSVDLYTNPSSGYTWECECDEEGILVLVDSHYSPDAATLFKGKGGGQRTFTFAALGSGTVKVKFDYVKIGDPSGKSVSQYIYTYSVDDDGNITLCNTQQTM